MTAKRFNVGCQRQTEEALTRAFGTAPRLGMHRPGPPKCFPRCVLPFPGSVGCPRQWSLVCNATPNHSEGRSCGFGDGWQRAAGRTLLPPCSPHVGGPEGLEHSRVAPGLGRGHVGEFSPHRQAVRVQRRDRAVLHRAEMPQDGEGGGWAGSRGRRAGEPGGQ